MFGQRGSYDPLNGRGHVESLPLKVQEAHYAALVGSITLPSSASPVLGSRLDPEGWQRDAWRLWGKLGELSAPTSYLARVVSRLINWALTPAGATDPLDPDASLAVISQAMGVSSVEETVRLAALNFQVAGEFWLVQERPLAEDRTPATTGWSVYSVVQPKLREITDKARSAGRKVQRFYVPDPTDTSKARSAFQSVIDPAEDLATLSALSRAQNRSRIAQAGILLVPAEQKFAGGDPFGSGLEQAMSAAIADIHSASAYTPIKVEVAAELIDKVKHLTFDRPFDEKLPAKVEAAIRRIALGLEIPPELLLGLGDLNHWSAWVAQEEAYRGSIAPLADLCAGVLEFIVSAVHGESPTIKDDPTELLARRSSVRDAIEGAKIGAVGLDYVRRTMGAHDHDAPTPEDLETIRASAGTRSAAPGDPATNDRTAPQEGDPA